MNCGSLVLSTGAGHAHLFVSDPVNQAKCLNHFYLSSTRYPLRSEPEVQRIWELHRNAIYLHRQHDGKQTYCAINSQTQAGLKNDSQDRVVV